MSFIFKEATFDKMISFHHQKYGPQKSQVAFISHRMDVKMVKMMETSNCFDAKLIFTLKKTTFTKYPIHLFFSRREISLKVTHTVKFP